MRIRATLTALAAVWFQVRAATCHDEPAQEEVVQALLELQRAGQEHGKPDPVPDRSRAWEMMGVEQDVATVRRFYEAFARKDWNAAGECFTEDAVWHLPGRSPIAGDYRGWDAILADFFATLGPRSNGTFRAELVDVLVGEQVVVAFQHATGQRNGKRLDLTACQVMRFRDGRIAEVRGHYADQYQLDEFWS